VAQTYAIGQLASLSGLPVKTIRFYSDAGILPPSGRTDAGHRRYTETDLARLQLVRSLRELDLDLSTIRRVLAGHDNLGQILVAHLSALDARIRTLQRQRAVVRAAIGSSAPPTLRRLQALARLDRAERKHVLEHFWDGVLDRVPIDETAAARFRSVGVPELPDDATPEQLDAWLELAELASDEAFVQATRVNATWLREVAGERFDAVALQQATQRALTMAGVALAAGGESTDEVAVHAVDVFVGGWARALGRRDSRAFRAWLLQQIDAHTDPRAERFWQLVGIVQGGNGADGSFTTVAAAHQWLISALRHQVTGRAMLAKAAVPARGVRTHAP
jgi:DNA-binding transcriptional MerR regulator